MEGRSDGGRTEGHGCHVRVTHPKLEWRVGVSSVRGVPEREAALHPTHEAAGELVVHLLDGDLVEQIVVQGAVVMLGKLEGGPPDRDAHLLDNAKEILHAKPAARPRHVVVARARGVCVSRCGGVCACVLSLSLSLYVRVRCGFVVARWLRIHGPACGHDPSATPVRSAVHRSDGDGVKQYWRQREDLAPFLA